MTPDGPRIGNTPTAAGSTGRGERTPRARLRDFSGHGPMLQIARQTTNRSSTDKIDRDGLFSRCAAQAALAEGEERQELVFGIFLAMAKCYYY